VKLSDFLRWGPKKAEPPAPEAPISAHERRHALRGSSGWIYWSTDAGEAQRSRVNFLDSPDDAEGLRLRAPKAPPSHTVGWVVPESGKAFPCGIRSFEKRDDGCLAEVALDLQERPVPGAAGSRIHWVDDDRVVHSIPATVKNSGQALIEVGLQTNIPARRMVFLEGRHYGCLAICRGARPDGSRFILVVEAVSDSFTTAIAAAA
jgi:hypothetical protein